MSKLSYIVSGSGRISAVANGQPYAVDSDHPNYKPIKDALKAKDADVFVRLVDIPKVIETWAATPTAKGDKKVKVQHGVIYYGDKAVDNSLTKRILWMIDEGFDVAPFIAFLENLMLNPSRRAVTELYTWMEHQDIPITEDGCWLGYKFLNKAPDQTKKAGEPKDKEILLDVHSSTIRQWIGGSVEMARNEVDDNWGVACSQGLHVGSSRYPFSGSIKVIVKVNPKDVVSVPHGEGEKCRVCKYEIVDICKGVYNSPVVGSQGQSLKDEPEDDDDDVCEYCGDRYCDGECFDESEDE